MIWSSWLYAGSINMKNNNSPTYSFLFYTVFLRRQVSCFYQNPQRLARNQLFVHISKRTQISFISEGSRERNVFVYLAHKSSSALMIYIFAWFMLYVRHCCYCAKVEKLWRMLIFYMCVCYSGSQGMEPTTLFPRKTMHATNFAHVQQYSDKWDYTTASKSGLQKIAAAVLLSLSIQVPVNWLVMQPGEWSCAAGRITLG